MLQTGLVSNNWFAKTESIKTEDDNLLTWWYHLSRVSEIIASWDKSKHVQGQKTALFIKLTPQLSYFCQGWFKGLFNCSV